MRTVSDAFSPPAWGWSAVERRAGGHRVVLPTRVGMVRSAFQASRELILDTQRPELLNASIVGALTEIVCFRLMSSDALRAMERVWADSGVVCGRQVVASLPLGAYHAWNRLSGDSLCGRMF